MASKSLGTLTLDLVAKTAGFVQGMSKAERESAKWKKSVKKDIEAVGSAAKTGLAVVAGAAASGAAALGALVVSTAANAREIQNLSAVANTSVEDFQRLAYGASIYGVEQDKLADILKDTGDKVGDFLQNQGGPLKDFFDNIAPQVGVTADEFKNLSGPQALQLYVDSLEKANLSQSEMTFYMEAIASDATLLLPLLRNNGQAFGEFGEKAQAAGLVLSKMDFSRLEQAQRTIDETGMLWDGFTSLLAVEAAPVVAGIGNLFLDMAAGATDARDAASGAMETVTDAAGFAADAIEGVRRTFVVAGSTIAIFGLSTKDVMLTIAQSIIDFPTKATNQLIELMNTIPGIDVTPYSMGELSKSIQEEINLTRGAVNTGWDDINDTLMAPMPSDSIEKYVSEAKEMLRTIPGTVREVDAELKGWNPEKPAGDKPVLSGGTTSDPDQDFWGQWLEGAKVTMDDFQSLSQSVADNFSQQFGNAFESVLIDSENLNEALRGIADTILRSVVNAIGQMVAQWVAAQAVQLMLGNTATAASVTQAGVTASAWAPAASMASLASFGANSAPATAGIASTVAAANALALTGMAHDGIDSVPETGTWLLQKGERVMTADTSAKLDKRLDGSMMGNVQLINNGEPMTATTELTNGQMRIILNATRQQYIKDMNRGGSMYKATAAKTGVRRSPK